LLPGYWIVTYVQLYWRSLGIMPLQPIRRNTSRKPIDGIWASPSINIVGGGYFLFDEVFPDTDHKCLWIDITYITAFGHNMPAIVRPSARRLYCRDPHIVQNYLRIYERFIIKHSLLERARIQKQLHLILYPPFINKNMKIWIISDAKG
jgi:hypothetical protein